MKLTYDDAAHRQHLQTFMSKLSALIAESAFKENFPEETQYYLELLDYAKDLETNGFTVDDLENLSVHFKPTFWQSKTWSPPMEQRADGRWYCPEWYPPLEALHQQVTDVAFALRCSGEHI